MTPEMVPPLSDEMALVIDSWVSSFRKSPWAGVVRNDLWEATQRATIAGILARGAVITVALAPIVPGVHEARRVMGYAVTEPALECLHWVYTKRDYRGQGVGRALVESTTSFWLHPRYSHRTRGSGFLPRRFRWDPVPARVLQERAGSSKNDDIAVGG